MKENKQTKTISWLSSHPRGSQRKEAIFLFVCLSFSLTLNYYYFVYEYVCVPAWVYVHHVCASVLDVGTGN